MMTFGEAIKEMHNGEKVSRLGWNGKNMWIAYVASWSGDFKNEEPMPDDWQGYLPFIAMYTADKKLVPWLASQTDVLAIDWGIV